MGDRVAVMRGGKLQQVDTPQDLYDRPDNEFVAGFMGSPPMNLLRAGLESTGDVSRSCWEHSASRFPRPYARRTTFQRRGRASSSAFAPKTSRSSVATRRAPSRRASSVAKRWAPRFSCISRWWRPKTPHLRRERRGCAWSFVPRRSWRRWDRARASPSATTHVRFNVEHAHFFDATLRNEPSQTLPAVEHPTIHETRRVPVTTVTSTTPPLASSESSPSRESTDADVLDAAQRAASAAQDFAHRPLAWRAGLLRAMAEELEADSANLVEFAHQETALPLARLEGELRRTAFQLRFFADVILDGSFLHATIDHAGDSPMGPLPDLRRVRDAPWCGRHLWQFELSLRVLGARRRHRFRARGGMSGRHQGAPRPPGDEPGHLRRPRSRSPSASRRPRVCSRSSLASTSGTALVDAPPISAVGFTGSVGCRTGPVGASQCANAYPFLSLANSARPTPSS